MSSHSQSQGLKRVSNFHRELAKRVARGDTNAEILAEIKISPSRLSILKSNPLFDNVVEEYRKRLDDTFVQAHARLEERSLDVADELINCATNPVIDARDRIKAGFGILDRIGMSRGQSARPGKSGGQEVVFEQMLRVVKRQLDGPADEDESEDTEEALKQLESLGPDVEEGEWTEVG